MSDNRPTDEKDLDGIIIEWFVNTVNRSGKKDVEIAEILNLKPNAISKIRHGNRQLTSGEMLMLAEKLNAPLPRRGVDQNEAPPSPQSDLHELAFRHVEELEQASGQRMHPEAFLAEVMKVMQRLQMRNQSI